MRNRITLIHFVYGFRTDLTFTLDNNILYSEILINSDFSFELDELLSQDVDRVLDITKLILVSAFLDSITQLRDFPEGALVWALYSEQSRNFTLENEGIEINPLYPQGFLLQIDLSSDFSFLDIFLDL
ncbi:MAG: hypothetical protein FWC79_05935 [Oscillospiraceae bacterium]|nr:hypothetical protein [Oscillospiraceae bacterium]